MASAGEIRPSLVAVVLMLVAVSCQLNAINATADDSIPDLESVCQGVQCPVDCPSDSEMQYIAGHRHSDADHSYRREDDSPLSLEDETPVSVVGEDHRERRSIAMNNHPHESIKITPSANGAFLHQNQLPAQRSSSRLLWKRDLAEVGGEPEERSSLLDSCCPRKCVCRPCPIPPCPPDFVPSYDLGKPGQMGQPGSCCPHVLCAPGRLCRSQNFPPQTYAEGERWNEDSCVECRCEEGVRRCESPSCRPLACTQKVTLPGRCCPVCDETNSIFCPGHANCELSCRHGFRREGSCSLCACSPKPANGTMTTPAAATTKTTAVITTMVPPSTVASTTTTWITDPATDGQELERNEQPPETPAVHSGAVQHESYDIGTEPGNHSTYGSSPVDSTGGGGDSTKGADVVGSILIILVGIAFTVFVVAVVLYYWKKKKQHGKYSTVPISSAVSTTTTNTTASISMV